eukprot:15352730-Ditylum_brightwellii.AAC.2
MPKEVIQHINVLVWHNPAGVHFQSCNGNELEDEHVPLINGTQLDKDDANSDYAPSDSYLQDDDDENDNTYQPEDTTEEVGNFLPTG